MNKENHTSNFWAGIGKATAVLTLLGVVIAVIVGVTQIIAWINTDGARIEATGKFVTFEYPK